MATDTVALRADCERATLTSHAHGPISMRVEALSRHGLEALYLPGSAGASVEYRGHRDDLVKAGCARLEGLRYNRFYDAAHGAVFWVSTKAGRGKRGHIAVTYFTNSHNFAASLPGMRELFPRILDTMSPAAALNQFFDALMRPQKGKKPRPQLRLVVDNTKR